MEQKVTVGEIQHPSMARIAKVVKVSVQELDRVKQNRDGVVGIPKKHLEEKAKALADQGEWTLFNDVLALLVFGIILFPNVDGLVYLAAIDVFLATLAMEGYNPENRYGFLPSSGHPKIPSNSSMVGAN